MEHNIYRILKAEDTMKKLALVFIIIFASNMVYSLDMVLGLKANFIPSVGGVRSGLDDKNYLASESYFNNIGAGIFFDMVYARLDVEYNMSLAGNVDIQRMVASGTEISITPTNYGAATLSALSFDLMFKLPLDIGIGSIWIGAGFGYRMYLAMDYNGDGIDDLGTTFNMMNDIYALVGGGLNLNFGTAIYLIPSFTLGYNLMPKMNDAAELPGNNYVYWMYEYKYNVALGIRI